MSTISQRSTFIRSERIAGGILPKVLSSFDMVAIFIAIVLFIQNAAVVSGAGAAAYTYWILGFITFLVPGAIVTGQLGLMFPGEGSIYVWTTKAFGNFLGFLAGFCAWWPGILVLIVAGDTVVSFIQSLGSLYNLPLLQDRGEPGLVIILIITISFLLSVLRFRLTQNLVNMIFLAYGSAIVLIGVAGVLWLLAGHASNTDLSLQTGKWVPNSGNLTFYGLVILALLGIEVPLNMGVEIKDMSSITRYLLWGSAVVMVAYLIATFGVMIAVPAGSQTPDGKYLATGGRDKLIHIWDTTSGNKIFTYAKHSTYVYGLAWSPDGRRIISTSFATVHIWDALTGENVVVYHDHSLWVYTVAWSSDGRYIATGGAEGEVHFWTDASGRNIYKYLASSRVVKAVAWSRTVGSIKIVVGCEDAIAHAWDAATGNTPLIYKGHNKEITSVAWSPNDLQIASGSRDMTVQIWDAHLGNTLYTYRGHTKEVYTVAWSPGGKFVASAGEDKTIRIWDAVTGNTTYIHHCHTNAVCAIAWSPDGTRIASAGDDKTARIWQAS